MKKSLEYIKENQLDNLKNKTILVTGANSGIGLAFCKLASICGANLILAVRNIKKGEKAREEILELNNKIDVKIMKLDLADFDSIDSFVNEIKDNNIDIDCFYNNAGVMKMKDQKTKQGYELVMGTNLIGTYYLTNKILPYLRNLSHKVNYILTTSLSSYYVKMPKDTLFKYRSDSLANYALTKLCTMHLYLYLKETYKDTNIDFSLVHPGVTYTPLIEKGYKNKAFVKIAEWFMKLFFHNPYQASLSTFKALAKPSYYGPRGLLKAKGYPKEDKLSKKISKNYLNTIEKLNKLI